MAVLFNINDETAGSTLASDIQAVEELSALEAQCDKAIQDLEVLNHTMEMNHAAIALLETCKAALHDIIPAATAAIEPVKQFATGIGAVREEMGNTSFRNW